MKSTYLILQYFFLALFACFVVFAIPHPAYAEGGCTAITVVDAWPVNDPTHIYKDDTPKGHTVLTDAYIDSATPDGKPLTYAEEGGNEYSAKDLKVINCHVGKVVDDPVANKWHWDLVLNNDDSNSSQILINTVQRKLEDLSSSNPSIQISMATLGSASYAYINDPNSACGKATAAALNGNTIMAGMLDDVCQPREAPQ